MHKKGNSITQNESLIKSDNEIFWGKQDEMPGWTIAVGKLGGGDIKG